MSAPTRQKAALLLTVAMAAGLVACEEAGAPLQPPDRSGGETVRAVEGTDPTSLRPLSDSWPSTPTGTASASLSASVAAAASPAEVLIFGDFPPAKSELEGVLTSMGHSVVNVASLPEDLSTFDVVWHIGGFLPLTADEQTRLAAFLADGGGVHLSGERSCCELLNGSLEAFVNAVVVGDGDITVGGLGDFEPIGPFFTFNPGAVGEITTTPNTLDSWSPAVAGGMAGLDSDNVLVSHDETGTPNGGVWECDDLAAGEGQVTVLMDVNWLDPSVNPPATRDAQIANIETFLQRSCVSTIPVDIDLRPGSERNAVALRSRGRLPVAILSTPDFVAADVDPATVTLGDDDADDVSVATRPNGGLFTDLEDVDDDGDLDLVLWFEVRALVDGGDLDTSTTELVLKGETFDGTPIRGSDGVALVGGGRPGR